MPIIKNKKLLLNMEEIKTWILENLFSIITSILGGGSLLGWMQERKKRKIEERQMTSDALKSMQDAYDRFTQDSLERYTVLKEEIDDLKKKLNNVTTELQTEKEKYRKLEFEYNKIKGNVNKLQKGK